MFNQIRFLLIFPLLLCVCINCAWCDFAIIQNGKPSCSIVMPENPTDQEKFAISELNVFIDKLTGIALEKKSDSSPLPEGNSILIGIYGDNRYIDDLSSRRLISHKNELAEEETIVKVVHDGERTHLVITGKQGRSVIYGVYETIESMIKKATGFSIVDTDFYLTHVPSIVINDLNIRSKPFYPIRSTIAQEDPVWLSRHRLNVSGAEGVWSGTGIDDGLGSAFKYVYDSQFDDMQDETLIQRWKRIDNLRDRLWKLNETGIEPYLFMYVMGEPTKAMMRNRPDLLDDEVEYQNSRNGESYRPISWTKPESRNMIKELVKSIIRTYSPQLKGFHLRSWGWETRAPSGDNAQLQEQLWDIYFDIISAAREVDPNFKFIISGYGNSWLKDPDSNYIAKLPKGSILMQKWGVDGEPTNDPEISNDFIGTVSKYGQRIVIISHDVEEAMPLWMVEADLFAKGVRKYANTSNLNGLGGFTLQGDIGLAHLDKIVSSRLNWSPNENYVALMKNYLISYYGVTSAEYILSGIRYNTKALSDYFSDYAGTLSLTGEYGNGSRGYATRFWNIIGRDAVKDTLSMPDLKNVQYAKERLVSLLPVQQKSANDMYSAKKSLYPVSDQALSDYYDGMHLMKMWVRFFESRLRLTEAKESGFKGETSEQVKQKISSATEYSREMQGEIARINKFVNVFDYKDDTARDSLIKPINEEIEFLKSFDPKSIISMIGQSSKYDESYLAINNLLIHPSPASVSATFCYELESNADDVTITIYTISGRKVKSIIGASAIKGYNEEMWDTRNDDGDKVANGTYFYKMVAEKDSKKVQRIGKLSIIR
jgi:hypothetical protein